MRYIRHRTSAHRGRRGLIRPAARGTAADSPFSWSRVPPSQRSGQMSSWKKPGLALTVSCKPRSSAHSTRHSKGPRAASRHRRLRSRRALRIVTADIAEPTPAASVLQASGFRCDLSGFRLDAAPEGRSGLGRAFRRNTAARLYLIEAPHNPEVAGSNPAPAISRGALRGSFTPKVTAWVGSRPIVLVDDRSGSLFEAKAPHSRDRGASFFYRLQYGST